MFKRYRAGRGERTAGLVLALVVEALLVLIVLTLGASIGQREPDKPAIAMVRFKAAAENPTPTPREEEAPDISPAEPTRPRTPEPQQAAPQAEPKVQPPPAQQVIRLSPKDMASADIAAPPRPPAPPAAVAKRPMMGPPDTRPAPADTARVGGSGPNGEPLYAAAWYREPYDDELRGYLSTATGPGWGLIACRTAPDFRVEDCVKIDEYPTGSNIARAALAAAWQFKVRPPRIGGQPKIGEWVRIRIDYDYRRK